MKKSICGNYLVLMVIILGGLLLVTSCKKEKVIFTPAGTVTDVEGITYNAIKIGTQILMAENLRTTHLKYGLPIPLAIGRNEWFSRGTPAHCWYNNDSSSYYAKYGALYNWYAVNTGNLCPTGWHVPSDEEWRTLIDNLGGISVAGGKMKETGTTSWIEKNEGASNKSGFTGLPGGYRWYDSGFEGLGVQGGWWSSTEIIESEYNRNSLIWEKHYYGGIIYLTNNSTACNIGASVQNTGRSVRCIKN
jgi:uncharacterized protein (TIGR02145 family)